MARRRGQRRKPLFARVYHRRLSEDTRDGRAGGAGALEKLVATS